ncbi:hypothetical protein M231_04537 [Tremella mesenterica]|uniref:Diacylglycerol O-acyltransferase n=1 Tax=Tremella mesenterica TaxID=5217 RepID=A0A4Q1BK71_TREME|nr:hypothetical protein M231_04537 [Tremella mesenterica]
MSTGPTYSLRNRTSRQTLKDPDSTLSSHTSDSLQPPTESSSFPVKFDDPSSISSKPIDQVSQRHNQSSSLTGETSKMNSTSNAESSSGTSSYRIGMGIDDKFRKGGSKNSPKGKKSWLSSWSVISRKGTGKGNGNGNKDGNGGGDGDGDGDGQRQGKMKMKVGYEEKEEKESRKKRLRSPLLDRHKLQELSERISKGVEIKFAPLNIPPHRRLQTTAVLLWALLPLLCLVSFLLLMSVPITWPIIIPYLIWVQFDSAPNHGGRPKKWARGAKIWNYFAQYYPCSIVQEAQLPPTRPYLFGYHPHGIIGMGAFATFGTDATRFSEYFPGITPHLLTLESNFKVPFYRDILMLHGVASVSKAACANILSKGPGTAIAIVVGGAAESLSAHPGTADLTLKKRYGFIKIAIKQGAGLVPVFSFGENDVGSHLIPLPCVISPILLTSRISGINVHLYHCPY